MTCEVFTGPPFFYSLLCRRDRRRPQRMMTKKKKNHHITTLPLITTKKKKKNRHITTLPLITWYTTYRSTTFTIMQPSTRAGNMSRTNQFATSNRMSHMTRAALMSVSMSMAVVKRRVIVGLQRNTQVSIPVNRQRSVRASHRRSTLVANDAACAA